MKPLVVLQNAYKKGSLKEGWSEEKWLKELYTSRTGKRLKVILIYGTDVILPSKVKCKPFSNVVPIRSNAEIY